MPVQSVGPSASLLSRSVWLGSNADLSPSLSVVLYIHGGGFVFGNASLWSVSLQRLCDVALARGVTLRALCVEYPLADEGLDHGYQRNIETIVAAFDYLIEEVGIPAHQIVIAGDSAGGNLATATALALRDRAWRQQALYGRHAVSVRASLPAAMLLISPWTDLTPTARWRTRHHPTDPFAHAADTGNVDYIDREVLTKFSIIYMANSQRRTRELLRQRALGARVDGWQVGEEVEETVRPPMWRASSSSASSLSRLRSQSCASNSSRSSSFSLSDSSSAYPSRRMLAPEGIDESAGDCAGNDGGGDASDDDEPTIDRSAEEDEERAIEVVREENRLPVSTNPSEAPLATAAAAADASALESPLSSSFSLLSPVHGDLRELPPAHVVYGALEAIAPDIASFTSRLRGAGVVVSEEISSRLTHNYVLLDPVFGSEASAAWRRCGEFVAEQLLQRAREHSDHKEALARNLFSTAAFIDAHP